MKFLKALINSIITGLFFSSLLALLILDLNVTIKFSYILLGQLTVFNFATYGLLIAVASLFIFFMVQFFSGKSFKIRFISPSFLMISFTVVLILFIVIFRENFRHYISFFNTEIHSLLDTQFLVLLFLGGLGILFLYGYLYYRKNITFLIAYFVSFIAIISYCGYQRILYPEQSTFEKIGQLEAASVDKNVTIFGMQGLSFDFIIPLINQGKLPNFAWLMEQGSWGRLENYSPNVLIALNTSLNTGKLPAKHLEFSPTTHRLLNITQKIDIIPRFIFYMGLRRIGFLETFPRSPKYSSKDMWRIFEENNISHVKMDPLFSMKVENPSENTQADFNRFNKDYKYEYLGIFDHLKNALLSDLDLEEKFTNEKNASEAQMSYLLLVGLNLVQSYFYKYNFPDMYGDIDQEKINKYSTVIEKYYELYDQIIGKHLVTMKEDELLIVYSPHGVEPLPIWKRIAFWIFEDPDVSASHSNSREGVVFFYGKNIIHGRHIEGMRLIDMAPTLLNYLELPVGKDMDGIVNSSMFLEDFKIGNPVLYISSYEEVEIKVPESPQ
ncbi:hypothetical protein ACFLT2_09845 [Acidobacteriota bacterium]